MTRMATMGLLLLLLSSLSGDTTAQGNGVIVIGHEKVVQRGTLVTAPNLIIQMTQRTATGMSEVHLKETDTIHVLGGSATFVTGGEMIASTLTAPGQYRGTGLRGGDEHHLVKDDVIVVPAGVPHWFREVPQSVDYYVVKVVAP
ncbi:MAG: hypothetical protein ABI051_12705 [Vicinamibacterales bacterium]